MNYLVVKKSRKSIPPLPPTPDPKSPISPKDPTPSKDILSSKRHSMNYVTVEGVKLRTGYNDKGDWYLLVLKELFDNCTDFLWSEYQGATDAAIDVYIEKTSNSLLKIMVRNTNPKNIAVFEDLKLIFDFDMTAGSKQDQHIITRGILGDALKQVLALGYVLIHTNDDGNSFANRQWEYPLIIRCNKKERQVFLNVDKSNQIIATEIKENPDANITFTDTEIQVTLPIIEEVSDYLSIDRIEQFCKQYPIFTTDISFSFKLVDNTPDDKVKAENTKKGELMSELAKALVSPPRKAARGIEYPAIHAIATKWNNKASIHSYKPGKYTTFIESVYDKKNTTVYERIQQLREGTNMKMTPDTEISIEDLVNDPDKDKKMADLFWKQRSVLPPPDKLSLPYTTNNTRKDALVKRIARLYDRKLNTKKAVYKAINGLYKDDVISYPYVFEIIAIPYSDESIDNNEDWVYSEFKGSVNYSISPRGNIFEGEYKWDDPKKSTDFFEPSAQTAPGILEVYNFYYFKHSSANAKLPCVIFANLISPVRDYHGADKSRIDTSPFTEVIIKACRRIAEGIQSFRAAGWEFETKSSRSFNPIREKKKTIDDIMTEVLKGFV
jgi:hypothetical protein